MRGKSQRRKVGLALGGGAARGLAHIGVLEVLESEGIPVDMIAGTSMGAVVGALYAQGKEASQIRKLAVDLGPQRFSWLADLTLPKTGLVRGRRIEENLRSIIGNIEFGDLRIPFACVATDIGNCEEVVIREGLVWPAIRASISIPVVLAVAKWEGRYLVDGSLVNPVPVSVLKAMGADFVIAVNVIPDRVAGETKEPNIFGVMMQTLHMAGCQILKFALSEADIVIAPQVEQIGYGDFHRAEECSLQGWLAAQDAVPEIKRRYSVRRHNTLPT